ncbi:hypothetical protein ASALC70_01537 [Alcanivorax sp. ALC70]|nr:hypothetical protein ASALC70_01537 [Alcanivorax sp. ALC70]
MPRLFVAAAVGGAAGDQAQEHHHQGAQQHHPVGVAAGIGREKAAAGDQHAAEGTTQQAADQSRHANGQPVPGDVQGALGVAEEAVVAGDGQHHHPGKNDRQDQGTAGALFEGAGQFLDGEHDPRQGRVERRRHAGGAAGHDQRGIHVLLLQPSDAPHGIHHGGAHVHARPLAADAGAAEQAHAGERELHQDHAEGKKGGPQPVIALLENDQHLGDTTALGLRTGAAHHRHHQQHAQRRDQDRQQRGALLHLEKQAGAILRHPGEPHRDQAHQQGADPEHHPHFPVFQSPELPASQTPGAKQVVSQQTAGALWLVHGTPLCSGRAARRGRACETAARAIGQERMLGSITDGFSIAPGAATLQCRAPINL